MPAIRPWRTEPWRPTPSVGALLPCNVVLRDDGDQILVEAMDPLAVLGMVDDPAIRPVALEARERLERVIAALDATT